MRPAEDQQREAVVVDMAALRRDAERWRWAKAHPRMAVYIFDLEWMEQRDFDVAIDTEMQQAVPINLCLNCISCQFNCEAGKWNLNGQEIDCFGCDGSGIETKCLACYGPECTSCKTRVKTPKKDTNALPFCDECYEEMRRGCNDE